MTQHNKDLARGLHVLHYSALARSREVIDATDNTLYPLSKPPSALPVPLVQRSSDRSSLSCRNTISKLDHYLLHLLSGQLDCQSKPTFTDSPVKTSNLTVGKPKSSFPPKSSRSLFLPHTHAPTSTRHSIRGRNCRLEM